MYKECVIILCITVVPLFNGHSYQRPPLLSGQISDALRVNYY